MARFVQIALRAMTPPMKAAVIPVNMVPKTGRAALHNVGAAPETVAGSDKAPLVPNAVHMHHSSSPNPPIVYPTRPNEPFID